MNIKVETTDMNEKPTPALVPKLRFPEFRDAGGWTEKPIKAAAEINPANGGLPESFVYIDLESVDAGELKAKERISRVGAPSRAQRLVEHGDIIYQVVRPYQRNNLLCEFDDNEIYVASTGYAQLRAKGSNRFLYQSIHTDSFVGRVIAKCTGSNYPAINSSDLAEIHLPIPPTLAEQQKIAECLSSVDELMAAQTRKVDALKTHKKGLMQQLFPREGETQPRLRFPEFKNAGEWKLRPLGELVELQSGFAFSSSNFGREGRKLVTPKNFTKHGHGNFDESVSKYTTEDVPERFVCEPGDLLVLLTDLTPTCELLGKPLLLEEKDGTVLLNQRVARVEPSASKLEALFLKYVCLSETYSQRIIKTATGSTVKHSSNKVLQEMPLFHPALPEQQCIASCLSSLDALITAETQKLEALKTHKKGLMQQLFPSPERVEA